MSVLGRWVVISVALCGACEKVSHENIDRWENTEKGAGKLRDAFSGKHPADLRAHAAQVLIRIGELDFVTARLDDMKPATRDAILAPLVARLSRDAALEDELSRPQPHHVAAKDALFELRERAPPAVRASIDSTLIAWLTGGYYEGRSKSGRYSGQRIVRAIGAGAGPALVAAARRVLDAPTAENKGAKIGDELLGSLALSTDPDALNLLLDLCEKPQLDPTLQGRATAALDRAFIHPRGLEPAPGAPLGSVAGRLAALAKSEETPPRTGDVAIALLARIGPGCLPTFVDLVSHTHRNPSFRWAALQNGIRCAGAEGVEPLVEALPTGGRYERAMLDKYLWRETLALPRRGMVAASARRLLGSRSWVARVTGVELLGKLQIRDKTTADADLISRLARDGTRLRGWYPKTERKPDPTLGQVAARVARNLREVAQPTKSK